MKNNGRPSKSVEDTAKWRLFDETVSKVRDIFRDMPTPELNAMIDEAVSNVREERRRRFEK